ncbi:MAG: DNA polymerase III subunit delta [Agarilytica sp.]
MGSLRLDQLNSALNKDIAPIYLVSGDETLLVQEVCDTIRSRAHKQGFIERELHHTDAGFKWETLTNSASALSLFSDKKIIEVRVHNGKPGDAGSKAITEYCAHADENTLLLLILPKIDKRSQSSKWYKAISQHGEIVTVWPVSTQQLPHWIEQRMSSQGLTADREAIEILSAKVEGNLLAAVQEIEKLKLLAENKHIDAQTMADAVSNSARYDVFSLVDKTLMGDSRAAITCLQGLRAEGTETTLVLWALSREIRTLTSIKEGVENGKSFDLCAKQNGVWDKRKGTVKHAIYRLHLKQLHNLVRKSSHADKMIKGLVRGDVWNQLIDIVLSMSGTEALHPRTQKMLLQSAR